MLLNCIPGRFNEHILADVGPGTTCEAPTERRFVRNPNAETQFQRRAKRRFTSLESRARLQLSDGNKRAVKITVRNLTVAVCHRHHYQRRRRRPRMPGSALCTHTHLQDLRPALEVRGARGGRHQVGARDGEKGAELARPRPRHRLQVHPRGPLRVHVQQDVGVPRRQ
eukprot:756696-Prorocentrum_minimum.AAC.1